MPYSCLTHLTSINPLKINTCVPGVVIVDQVTPLPVEDGEEKEVTRAQVKHTAISLNIPVHLLRSSLPLLTQGLHLFLVNVINIAIAFNTNSIANNNNNKTRK